MDKFSQKRPYYKRKVPKSPDHDGKLKKVLLSIFFLFVMIWAVLGVLRSDLFHLQKLEIEGNNHTQESEITEALPVSYGDNILRMSLAELEAKILTIPRIKSVEVRRVLPNTLHVEVKERRILVLIPYQEYFLEIGENGQVVGITVTPHTYDSPLLTGLVPVSGTIGEIVLSDKLLSEVAALCEALSEESMMVSEINAAEENNLILVTMDGLVVWVGNKNFIEKTRILEQIIGQLSGRQGEGYLDLRVPTAPAFHIVEPKNVKNN